MLTLTVGRYVFLKIFISGVETLPTENIMNVLPSMDSQNIERDSNGVVYIKPMPILVYAVGVAIGIFAIGALVRGEIGLGIAGIVLGIIVFLRSRSGMGSSLEFNPKTRAFKIGSNSNAITISFDEIAGFGVATQKETGSFTEKRILVILKDGRAIEIGVITDANEKKREEKVSNMIKFLYETTGIVLNVNEDNQSGIEKN
jgi:hypothetical protein